MYLRALWLHQVLSQIYLKKDKDVLHRQTLQHKRKYELEPLKCLHNLPLQRDHLYCATVHIFMICKHFNAFPLSNHFTRTLFWYTVFRAHTPEVCKQEASCHSTWVLDQVLFLSCCLCQIHARLCQNTQGSHKSSQLYCILSECNLFEITLDL